MFSTPSFFTHEYLSSLKFKEIQKLSVQYNVNKRWAKKQELIENLLALKENNKSINGNKQDDEAEWKDGSTIFNDLNLNRDNEVNRRLTFNVNTKGKVDTAGPQTTFQDEIKTSEKQMYSRETYDIPPKQIDLSVEPLKESRATFDIPQNKSLIHACNLPFDVSQNENKLLDTSKLKNVNVKSGKETSNLKNFTNPEITVTADNPGYKEKLRTVKFDSNLKDGKLKGNSKTISQGNMLTIPQSRTIRRTKKDGEIRKKDSSPISMSNKSINIKKLSRLPVKKIEMAAKSPVFSSVKKSVNKQSIINSLTKSQNGVGLPSKLPVKLDFTEKSPETNTLKEKQENFQKKILKTADGNSKLKSNYVKVNFSNLTPSAMKSSRVTPLKKTPLAKGKNERHVLGRLNSSNVRTPGTENKPPITTKPLTATKMPDFNKIHKKQFEQMDSLYDYIRKKEERIRKLFGAPQPGQKLQVQMKSTPLFQFQSETVNNKSKEKGNLKSITTPLKKKENDSKLAQKEAVKSRLPPSKSQTSIKDKNRSLIQGVRTNKRFELQMKLRNM